MIEELYNNYFHDIFLYLRSITKSEQLAEELTQETFFKAMRSLDKFKEDCDVRTWLCQIAKNSYYSYCRKNKRMSYEEIPGSTEDSSISIELSLENSETSAWIHKILHNMSKPYKEVFTLRVFGELSYKQIAQLFGKTDNWAAVTFHRAKLKIIDELEEKS